MTSLVLRIGAKPIREYRSFSESTAKRRARNQSALVDQYFRQNFGGRDKRVPVFIQTARWQSGYARDCKSRHPGSIPGRASTNQHTLDPSSHITY